MKKLMLTVAIVCATVMSYGAAVQWDAGTVIDANGDTAGKAQVTGYLFQLAADSYTAYAAMDAATLSKTIYADYKDSLTSAIATDTTSKKGALTLEGIDATAGTAVYAAILYVDTTLDKTYFMGNVASVEWSGIGTPTFENLASTLGYSSGDTSWQSVPEPTSGLLMLLGMAGLALRRKRA